MPSLSVVRAFNASFFPSYTPVAIFVGGTSGIGRGMAEAFAQHTKGNAHIVVVGRNRAAAEAIIATFPKATAPGAKHEFVQCDITLMSNVRRVAGEISARIPRINFLALTPGVMTTSGRNESEEGIDRKLAVHYYGRWRFIRDLMPALEAAHAAGEDAKVISVLSAAHGGGKIDLEDLGLKKNYSLGNAAASATTYNDLMINDFAARHSGLTFIHSYPGGVRTNLLKSSDSNLLNVAGTVLLPFLLPFTYSVEAAGEHQLYALLKAGPGAGRTNDRGDDMGLERAYYGSPEAMRRLWKHTNEATGV
ncbi:NAD(P)-binding protein [Mycena vitilis]|nr:NAD(P)-binding protein [Mycena vitilis]